MLLNQVNGSCWSAKKQAGWMLNKIKSLYESIILDHPKITLFVILVVLAGLMAGLPRFKLDASADSLTLEHDNSIDYYREISTRYQSGDFLVITYTPKDDLFSDESLNNLKALRDELLAVDGVVGANTILDVPLIYSPLLTVDEVLGGLPTLLTPGVDREAAKKEFLTSPIYEELILSPDAKTTAIQLNFAIDKKYIDLVRRRDQLRMQRTDSGLSSEEEVELKIVTKEFLDYRTIKGEEDHARVAIVRDITNKYKDNAEIFLGGVSMITADMIAFISSDLMIFGLVIVLFILASLAVIFRQPRFVLLPFITCAITVTMMLGFLSWLDWRMTVISNNFVALLLILTLAITIHLVVRYRELHAKNSGWSQHQLVMRTVTMMVLPCLYTSLTTMVAFVSLVVSDIKPVIDFGWMMTIGLALAFVMSFVLLPASLMILPKGEPKDKGDNSGALTLVFSRFAEKHGNFVLGISVVVAVASVYGISNLIVENRPIDYFHESTEIYQGMSVIDKELGGTTSLDIILDVRKEKPKVESVVAVSNGNSTDSDEYGDEVDPFAVDVSEDSGGEDYEDPFADDGADAFAEEDPFSDEGDDAFEDAFAEDGDDAFADSSDSKNNAGQPQKNLDSYWFGVTGLEEVEQLHDYLNSLPEVGKVQSMAVAYKVVKDVYRGGLNDFELAILRNRLPPDVSDLLVAPYLSYEADQTRITLRAKETDPNLRRVELIEKIRDYTINTMGLQPEQVHFTGLLVLYNNMLQSLFKSQIVTMGAVFLGIMVMFLILFRSITFSVVAIIPNMLAAGCVLGSMGLAGIPLDLMNIMVAAITVGMGVDHAIHYIHRFKQEFAIDRNYVNAMHRSHESIGRAMYYTSITIIVGFSILMLSQFIPSIYFGLLTSLAMFVAIMGSLTLLPKLILLTKPLGKEGFGDF